MAAALKEKGAVVTKETKARMTKKITELVVSTKKEISLDDAKDIRDKAKPLVRAGADIPENEKGLSYIRKAILEDLRKFKLELESQGKGSASASAAAGR